MNTDVLYRVAKKIAEKDNFLDTDSVYNRIKKLAIAIEDDKQLSFSMMHYSENEIADFFDIFIKILDSDKAIISNNKKKGEQFNPNRKLIHMVVNGDLDLSLDLLLHTFLCEGYYKSRYASSGFIPNFGIMYDDLTQEWNKYNQGFRSVIRKKSGTAYEKCIQCMDKFIKEYVVGAVNENRIKHNNITLYNPLAVVYINRKMVDTFCDIFMQSVLYLIIDNEEICEEKRASVLHKILEKIVNYKKNLSYNDAEVERHSVMWDFAIHIDSIEMKNEYNTYFEIFDLLCNQMQEEGYVYEVKNEYECQKRYLQDFEHKCDYQAIILEGKQEKTERFSKHLCDCQELCLLLYLITGRQLCSEYLQHVKVVYREIIEDKLKYNNKQSRTILRNLEKMDLPTFESIKESAFIREKISRGFFREKGLGKYYEIKCDIQKELYECMLIAYECNDEMLKEKRLKRLFIDMKKILLHEMEGL